MATFSTMSELFVANLQKGGISASDPAVLEIVQRLGSNGITVTVHSIHAIDTSRCGCHHNVWPASPVSSFPAFRTM